MRKEIPRLAAIGLIVSAGVSSAADPTTQTTAMSFEKCLATKAQVIAKLGVNPKDIIEIVNTSSMTMTRVCTSDGSVLITCSKADQKMALTQSPHGADVGCP